MARWPMLAVLSIVVSTGCATSVEAGLANAPRLGGGGLADERVRDVIANGGDSCGRYAEHGPLRGSACPAGPHPVAATMPLSAAGGAKGQGVVVPWLKHFYVGWPCPHRALLQETNTLAWASSARATACRIP
jgi:hypothetical protein